MRFLEPRLCRLLMPLVLGTQWLWAHGGYHDALAALDAELARRGDKAELWHRRARLHLEHGEWTWVLVDLERAERLGPAASDSEWVRGQALLLGGLEAAALAAFDAFLQRHPDHTGGRLSRARLRLRRGQPGLALADYRLALEQKVDAEAVLEGVEALTGQGLVEEAADLLAQHLRRLGDVPFLLRRALELEWSLGRHADALGRVQALARGAPRPEPWMARRAELLDQAGRTQEALAAWRALQEHLQRLPNLERGLPEVWPLVERSSQAIGDLQRRAAKAPTASGSGT